MKVQKYSFIMSVLFVFLTACSSHEAYAPVDDAWHQHNRQTTSYRVRPGETLYSVAWRYDLDYRNLARYNHLKPPYALIIGQRLVLRPEEKGMSSDSVASTTSTRIHKEVRPSSKKTKKTNRNEAKQPTTAVASDSETSTTTDQTEAQLAEVSAPIGKWNWPVRGPILHNFSSQDGQKGIDIGGAKGTPIKAAASGQVAYAGRGLRGYGNLLIIKHNNIFLSAYAHNDKLLVKEGEKVKAGQVIAEMGNSDANNVHLHFEIRKAGKPVNPLTYLP